MIIFPKKNQVLSGNLILPREKNLSAADNPEQDSYNSYDKQNMYDTTRLISKVPNSPGNYKDNCNEIQ